MKIWASIIFAYSMFFLCLTAGCSKKAVSESVESVPVDEDISDLSSENEDSSKIYEIEISDDDDGKLDSDDLQMRYEQMGWKKNYKQIVEENEKSWADYYSENENIPFEWHCYSLIYINDDGVPELFVGLPMGEKVIYSISERNELIDLQLPSLNGGIEGVGYINKGNMMLDGHSSVGHPCEYIISIEQNDFKWVTWLSASYIDENGNGRIDDTENVWYPYPVGNNYDEAYADANWNDCWVRLKNESDSSDVIQGIKACDIDGQVLDNNPLLWESEMFRDYYESAVSVDEIMGILSN
ncbi:hypothetical protein [Butyrivibrio sp. AE3004]|uniref:hypothetical protein n=1 Tax=Butyrivibrio sp. AE3004 TaxID=1506994 RepID=UPI00049421EA|nr:hypothetical protein [Butyrivibrio sp. AE3004]